jgi:hypothetical protein
MQHGARARAGLHEGIDDKKPARCFGSVVRLGQARVRKMNVGEAIVALAPGFRGTFNMAQDREGDGLAVSRREKREYTLLFVI